MLVMVAMGTIYNFVKLNEFTKARFGSANDLQSNWLVGVAGCFFFSVLVLFVCFSVLFRSRSGCYSDGNIGAIKHRFTFPITNVAFTIAIVCFVSVGYVYILTIQQILFSQWNCFAQAILLLL